MHFENDWSKTISINYKCISQMFFHLESYHLCSMGKGNGESSYNLLFEYVISSQCYIGQISILKLISFAFIYITSRVNDIREMYFGNYIREMYS